MSTSSTPRDTGATTVVFALVVVVLFAVAALGVELTNMYTRDRAVQTTADLAAFAGAQELPDVCGAFAQALETLNDEGNAVRDDDQDPRELDRAEPATMSDLDPEDPETVLNGEIEIFGGVSPDGSVGDGYRLDTSDCLENPTAGEPRDGTGTSTAQEGPGRAIRVTTPGRTVAFAFANVFSLLPGREAIGSAEVRAVAAVGLSAPEGTTVLPMFLPDGCVGPVGGPAVLGAVTPPQPPRAPVFDPPGTGGPAVTSLLPATLPLGYAGSVRLRIAGLAENPSDVPVVVDLHPGDGGARVPPEPTEALDTTLRGEPQEVVREGVTRWTADVDIAVPEEVTSASGTWFVRARQTGAGWTAADEAQELVVAPAPPPPGPCEGSATVRLGVLDAAGSGAVDASAAQAFITGLGQPLAAFGPSQLPGLDTSCVSDGNPLGAILSTRDGPTCLRVLEVEDEQLSDLLTAAWVGSEAGGKGRLATGELSPCPGPPSLQNPAVGGVPVSDGTLSCHLATRPDGGSYTLGDVLAGTAGSLEGSVVDDPRFGLIPVLHTTRRPVDGAWPVKTFRGAFVTNETWDFTENSGSPATCSSDSDCHGLALDGTQVREVSVLTFPLSALPESVEQGGNGVPWVAGTKDFVLLE